MSDFQVSTLAQKESGLSSQGAKALLKKYGPNALPETPPPTDLQLFLEQLKSPMVYILLVAGVVTFFLHEYSDTAVISLAVTVNTIFGFLQERKAGRALEALKRMVHPEAQIIRDSRLQTVPVEEIVPGDIVVLQQGDKIPADGNIIECNRMFIDEAMLTGESVPIEKKEKDKVFMGTVVVGGNAAFKVVGTGRETEMGKIAQSVSEGAEDTPLGKQLSRFGRQLSILVLILLFTVFSLGLILKLDPIDMFETSVALAVSAIPEGLLVGLTVVLAIGMQRILARKGLVRHLVSAETLGGVTTICVDKTGTLTQGRMQVVGVYGNEQELAKQVILANDLDDPIVIAAWDWGRGHLDQPDHLLEVHKRIDSLPFSSDVQYFASLNSWDSEHNMLFVNGAPEVLLQRSTLSEAEKNDIVSQIEKLSHDGMRLLGFARKKLAFKSAELTDADVDGDLEWIGLLSFSDPVRTDVKEALEKTRAAGIKLMVITGDYAKTAKSVLDFLQLDVLPENIILGAELETLSEEALNERIMTPGEVKLFARTKPEQKLRIVQILKQNGEVVAMMGDGVNDAPALSKADIGIVVGEATDVAKESASLVLLDSSFNTIVAAIEEGRGIFDNIRKIVLYLMCDAFIEIFAVIGALIFGLGLPLSAAQILWVNLVSDGFPHLALTIDPKAAGIMQLPPRSPREPLVAKWMYYLIGLVTVIGGLLAFALYYYAYNSTGDLAFARAVTFATVGTNSLVYVFSIRTLTLPFWKESPFDNRWLLVAVLAGLMFQLLPFMFDPVSNFLNVPSIGYYWIPVILSSIIMFFGIEVFKWVVFKRRYH